MTRRYIIWIGLVSLTAGIVLNTSLETRQQQDRLAEINREIKIEQERTRVLVAEWHSLKTPERLEALARRHLQGYDTIKPMQLANLADVPDRLPEAAPPVAVATAAPVAPIAEVAETAAPAPRPAAARQVAAITTPRARPATRPDTRPAARLAPVAAAAPAAEKQDDLARLIAQSEAPAARPAAPAAARADDGIRTIIERQQPHNGVVFASTGSAE